MKVLLYSKNLKMVEKSGVGRAIYHQQKALEENNIPCTMNHKEDFDIVHINTVFPSSLWMSKVAKARGKKVVYHAHSTEEDFKNSFRGSNLLAPLFKKWLMRCYDSGDLIITPTNYSKRLLEGYGLKNPIVNISNGIDLEYFSKNEAYSKRFREKYQLNENDKVIVSVGLYIERKGIIDFVELAKSLPEYTFIWFGYTNINTVSIHVKKAVETKLPNLHFPGYVSREELRNAYSGSDLFLFLTHEETEGIVLLEALAMKIPVLIRDIPIYENWLQDKENVYKGNFLEQFRWTIKGILDKELPSLVEHGYEVVAERDIKTIGQQLGNEYRKLLMH
ncbi:glycosyltransferase family 4 protein [Psychrobacillus sp. OK032]|uniref:glycosyltransferase family 4 protein n=1 Tax=Psychrobacillus sp. OK032 TaxID=1884358 RepID=UPI0008D50407|nr:glycosyltransferase family 4 protein [Psychrobacillus sp. OK032]SES34264.1 1,2-diacylglycerol-3-alpha-glucose alpha-1,2-glucosyltransferase [Psychrobacillus sp. OK032]